MTKINLEDWQAESLRLSTFIFSPIDPVNIDFWERLVGSPPEEKHSKPQQQLAKEEGPYLDGWLSVETRSNRIDWRLTYNPRSAPKELPVISSYAPLQGKFEKLMKKWFTHCPIVHRLAYGAVLLLPAENLHAAYSILNDLLPAIKIDSENTHDFHYRINRRRPSQHRNEELDINRLSTWSVANITTIGVEISLSAQGAPRATKLIDRSVCRLELDINTSPEFSEQMDGSIAAELFSELIALGNEIVFKGDIP